ncbi:MAG: mycothiol synthase, partial [Nocardioidaceae bacterium]
RLLDADGWEASTADGVRAVVDAATEADGSLPLDEAALLALRHGIDGTQLLVAEPDTASEPAGPAGPVGFVWLHGGAVELVVTPQSRGRGWGTALAGALADVPDTALNTAGPLTGWSHGDHPAAARLAERFGFTRARELWVMRRTLGELSGLPDLPGPAGEINIRAFDVGRDEDAFLAVNAAAFADHREQGRMTRDDLDERMAEEWFDPGGFFVAEAGGRMVGFHWTKVHPQPPGLGEVYVLGVSPQAQGSGLGRRLALVGLHHLAERGCREVMLFVESDNPAAVALYSRLGFTHAESDTHVQYARG